MELLPTELEVLSYLLRSGIPFDKDENGVQTQIYTLPEKSRIPLPADFWSACD